MLIGSVYLTCIDGIPYCPNCYREKFGKLHAHPIPDAVFAKGGITSVNVDHPSENEYIFYTHQLPDAKIRIHKLMWYPILGESYDSFWGIDRHSGKYVAVLFSDDDVASDGGPSYLQMTAYSPEEFKRVMRHLYDEPLNKVFDEVTEISWEEYLDVSVPIWQSKLAYYLTQNCGDIVKIVKFPYNSIFVYAEVTAGAYQQWRSGKTLMEQIDSIGELRAVANRYIEQIVPKIMRPCKGLYELFTNIYKKSTPSVDSTWNLIQVKDFCKEINLRHISPSQTTALFAFIETTFAKLLSRRIVVFQPPR